MGARRMREKPRCVVCSLIRNAPVHTGYGEEKHEYEPEPKAKWGQQRQPLNPRSEKTETYYREVRRPAVAKAVGNGRQPCQIRIEGVCTGYVEGIHETASRGRSGGLQRAVESGPTVPACHPCNRYVSEHPIEAQERGLMRSNTVTGKRHTPRGPVPRRPL